MDPMLATGNSACAGASLLKSRGARDIRFVCLLAAPEGIEHFKAEHPDVPIWTAAALLNNVFIVIELAMGGPGVSCCTGVGVLVCALLASGLIARNRIGITKPPKMRPKMPRWTPARGGWTAKQIALLGTDDDRSPPAVAGDGLRAMCAGVLDDFAQLRLSLSDRPDVSIHWVPNKPIVTMVIIVISRVDATP